MSAPYIPPKDADLSNWLANFQALVAVNYAAYGLTSGNATSVTTVNTAFQAAYTAAINPATRTPATVAAKDSAKATALATVRPFAIFIRNNAAVSDATKVSLGLTVPSTTPTPIPSPTSFPVLSMLSATPGQHHIRVENTDTPASKAKPYGSLQQQLFVYYGTTAIIDPDLASFLVVTTKSPVRVDTPIAEVGKVATYFGRWVTRTGKVGPWSSPVSMTVTY